MTNGSSAVSLDAYDEYGIPGTDSTGTVTNTGRFQYTGQIYIPELGMYDYKARIYSPRLGRFLQTDPLGYDGGINIYEYVGDDPIDKMDPMGTVWCSGTVIQCGAYDRALTLAAEAAKNHALSPSQRAGLSAEVQSIRNDDKYVILFRSKEFISTVESGSSAFSYTDAAKNGIVFTVLPNDFDKLFESYKEFAPGTVPGAERAAVAMHEGSHREDFEKGLIKHGNKTEENSPTQQKAVSRQLLTSQGARATCLEAEARTGLCQ
jgi:RHS repeat-associated protein